MRKAGVVMLLAAMVCVGVELPRAEPQKQPVQKAPVGAIRFPDMPGPITPKPDPSAMPKLTADVLYIIDSDEPIIVMSSPAGLVASSEDDGPLKIRGRFIDGNGKVETRVFKGKQVYTVEPIGVGRVELLIVPPGVTQEKDILRKTLDVDSGILPPTPPGPTPPGPTPPVPPVPPAPPPIPGKGLHVLIVYDTAQITAMPQAQQNVLYSKAVRDYLDSVTPLGVDGKTHEWRIYDQGVDASNETQLWQDALKRKRGSLPWIIVSNSTTGFEGPLPANVADATTLIKKYEEKPTSLPRITNGDK